MEIQKKTMNDKKEKEDFNLVIHHYVHYDQPEFQEIKKELKEIKLLINKNQKSNMATQQEILAQIDALAADNAKHLALSIKIDADIVKLEEAINNGLDGNIILSRLNTLKADSTKLTDALQATDDKTPEVTEPPATAKFTANTDLYVDADGNLTDDSTDSTIVFVQGEAYAVVSAEPLTLTGADGNSYEVTDYADSFTAV